MLFSTRSNGEIILSVKQNSLQISTQIKKRIKLFNTEHNENFALNVYEFGDN